MAKSPLGSRDDGSDVHQWKFLPMKGIEMASTLHKRIRQILESAGVGVACRVNTRQAMANWFIGREIVQVKQRDRRRTA